MMESKYKNKHILHIFLEVDAKVEHEKWMATYFESNSQLDKQRGKALYMLRGQWMQVILDKINHDPDW